MTAVQYNPAEKKLYKVGFLRQPRVVTEIRRPEPEAVLVLRTGTVVELTNEEMRVLLDREDGPLIARDLLVPVDVIDGSKEATEAGEEAGEYPEGGRAAEAGDKAEGQEPEAQVERKSKKSGK